MPQTEQSKLDTDDAFPALDLQLVAGGSLRLPVNAWTLLLVYRGNW